MNRRAFLQTSTICGWTAWAASVWRTRLPDGPLAMVRRRQTPFRTITYNVLACRGYPEREQNRSRLQHARRQMARRFALELAVYDADLITFQESPSREMVAEIAGHLNMQHAYFSGGFPGTIMTRHQLGESANCPACPKSPPLAPDLFSRHWGKAEITVGETAITVYTAHLHPADGDLRLRECEAMVAAMSEDLSAGKNVILQGDLNDGPDSPMYRRLVESGLQDAFAVKGTGEGLTCSSNHLRWRIDYVWSAGPISPTISECRVLAEGPFLDHADDPAGFALSDHLPVMATFLLD